ncbi:MAG TPA: hypothetical protein VIJ40_06370 [Acidimicrobiales bacterium]
MTENGAPVTSNVAATTNGIPGVTNEKSATTFNASTGCWSIPSAEAVSYDNLSGQGLFPINTTGWTNGNYSFQLTVTDTSGLSATSSVLTLAVSNAGPSVTWNTTNNESVSGATTITANAAPAPTGTAQIDSWCLTENGAPVTSNVAATTNGIPGVTNDKSATTFNASTGCWSIPSAEAVSYDNLSGQGLFPINTTGWTNGNYSFQLTVTDTSGLSATSSVLTLAVSNPKPAVEVTGVASGQTYAGTITAGYSVIFPSSQLSLTVTSACFSLDNGSCVASSQVSISTWQLNNGPHTLTVTIVDSDGRTTDATPITFVTKNPSATVTSYSLTSSPLNTNSTSATERVIIHFEYGSTITIHYGSSQLMAAALTRDVSLSKSSSLSVQLPKLKTSTKYFAQISTSGLNGSSETKVFSFTTPAIPAKSFPPSTGSPSSGTTSSGSSTKALWSGYASSCSTILTTNFTTFDSLFNAAMTKAVSEGKYSALHAVSVTGPYFAKEVEGCDHSPDTSLNSEVYSLALGIDITIGEIRSNAPLLTIAGTTSHFESIARTVSSRLNSDLAKS